MELKKREEIVKTLECCISGRPCRECGYKDKSKDTFGCRKQLLNNALALIKELTEELKDLEADYDRVYEQAEADIHGNMADGGTSCHWCIDKTKRDTVKRMQEGLKEYLDDFYNSGEDELLDVPDLIDQIAKEILDGRKQR